MIAKAEMTRSRAWAIANPERVRHLQQTWRQRNPEKAREYSKKWREKNRDKSKKSQREWRLRNIDKKKLKESIYRKRRFFYTRAKNAVIRTKHGETWALANAIFWLWHKQRGRCAMTGKRLDRSAELDHIIPVSKGGKNEPSNLQWLAPEVNQCKNDMTIDEFMAVCTSVLSHAKR